MNDLDEQLCLWRDLVQFDIGHRGLARDPADNLIRACADDFVQACHSLAEHPRRRVGIVTGFMIPSVDPPTGETDGPPGALFLARAFAKAGIEPVLLSDNAGLSALRHGVDFLSLDCPVVELTANLTVDTILAECGPLTHLIACERSGPSRTTGLNHTMRGRDITPWTAPAHRLFEGNRPYVTIGIGDGGNEIGMGKIAHDTISRNIPNGEMVACRTETDYLIVAGISNWGAYALAAGTLLLRQRFDGSIFDADQEQRLIEHLVRIAPLVDGVTGKQDATVDGTTWADYELPLRVIATTRITPPRG